MGDTAEHTEKDGPAAGGTRFRHLQTEWSHLEGDILTIISGVILNMSTHDSHTACVSDTSWKTKTLWRFLNQTEVTVPEFKRLGIIEGTY